MPAEPQSPGHVTVVAGFGKQADRRPVLLRKVGNSDRRDDAVAGEARVDSRIDDVERGKQEKRSSGNEQQQRIESVNEKADNRCNQNRRKQVGVRCKAAKLKRVIACQ